MIFDLRHDKEGFKEYAEKLISEEALVELTKKDKRTNQQNKYLHLILKWFALATGYSEEEVKLDIFKRQCNTDLFMKKVTGKNGLSRIQMKSTRELSTADMTTAIERFRNFSAKQGIYIPYPYEEQFLAEIMKELSRNAEWV